MCRYPGDEIMVLANERIVNGIKTRDLHNKDYVEVAERIRVLHELKKDFEMIENGPLQVGERLLWRVIAKIDGKQYIAHAEIKLGAPKNTPDGTNPFECGETSAIGRLLAFAGLGTVESIASYEEIARGQPFTKVVEQATSRQIVDSSPPQIAQEAEGARMLTQQQLEALATLYGKLDMEMPDVGKWSFEQASVGIRELNAKLKAS